MKKSALVLSLLLFLTLLFPARAEVQKSPFLDAALSALEKDNLFLLRYNELTGSHIDALFELGIPYLFGGTEEGGVFNKYPNYWKRLCWQDSEFFREGQVYVNGFDCVGFTRWVYHQCHLPAHPPLGDMILNYSDFKNNHIFTHREGQQMPPFEQMKDTLQVGDLFAMKHPYSTYRHIMMYIGTLRDFGFTPEETPELAPYLDYPLVAHCGTHPQYGERFQRFIDTHPEDFGNCLTTDGGVQVSILGVPLESAPYHIHVQNTDFAYFILSDGSWMTALDVFNLSSYCWFRM